MEERTGNFINGIKKVPRCVAVYDKLYNMIKEGEFSQEERLPSEPELAKIMGVSRMTLRQALSLLQDDGIVKNIRGKGNFLIKTELKRERGLEILSHPVYSGITEKIDEVELEFRIEPPSEYTTKILERKSPAVVFVDRWYKSSGKGVAYTFSVIPIETIGEENIDLGDKYQLLNYLENKLYEEGKYSSMHLTLSEAGNFSSERYSLSDNERFYLLGETVYSKNKYPAVHNKHYIPVEYGHIVINRREK